MRSILTFILIAMALLIVGCAEPPGPGSAEQVIRRGNVEDPANLDPAVAQDIHTFNVLTDLYEGLVSVAANGDLIPGAAESWTQSDDALTYTFTLRDDLRWSNGAVLTAADFERSLKRVADPATAASYGFLLQSIRNFDAIQNGEAAVATLGVTATSVNTLEIVLHRPTPYFLSVLTMPVAFPVFGDAARLSERTSELPIGNGAYRLIGRELGASILLQRNQHYWDMDNVPTEYVEYVSIADEVAEYNMYRAGELDITAVVPATHFAAAKTQLPGELRVAPMLGLYYLALDLTQPPFDDVRLREALSLAVDRQRIADILGRGEQPAYRVVPESVANTGEARYDWANVPADELRRRARTLFSAAGYNAENPLTIELLYDAGGIHEKVALAVTSMWQDALPITVNLKKREWLHFLDSRDVREDWDVMRFAWFGDYNDATTFLDIFVSTSDQNLASYRNSKYDDFLRIAAAINDAAARSEHLARAEQRLLDDYPVIPLYFYVSKHMVSPNIRGFEANALDRHPSRYLSKSP